MAHLDIVDFNQFVGYPPARTAFPNFFISPSVM